MNQRALEPSLNCKKMRGKFVALTCNQRSGMFALYSRRLGVRPKMRKLALLSAVSIALLSASQSALAQFEEGPPEGPPRPPIIAPPPPPPPVVEPPPPTFTLNLPTLLPNQLIPTDMTGLTDSGPDNELVPKTLNPDPNAPPGGATSDPNYEFSGNWEEFSSNYTSYGESISPYRFVAAYSRHMANRQPITSQGGVTHSEIPKNYAEPVFMRTKSAKLVKVNDEHLKLDYGAVLVRAGARPVFVSTVVNGERVMTRVAKAALAMVSSMDNSTTILNLTDDCCGALIAYVPTSTKTSQTHPINIGTGQVVEIHAPGTTPKTNAIATKVVINNPVVSDLAVQVADAHYIAAISKYNLKPVLSYSDMERVLKTAAATVWVRHSMRSDR
jgi:hypothetical protein